MNDDAKPEPKLPKKVEEKLNKLTQAQRIARLEKIVYHMDLRLDEVEQRQAQQHRAAMAEAKRTHEELDVVDLVQDFDRRLRLMEERAGIPRGEERKLTVERGEDGKHKVVAEEVKAPGTITTTDVPSRKGIRLHHRIDGGLNPDEYDD